MKKLKIRLTGKQARDKPGFKNAPFSTEPLNAV